MKKCYIITNLIIIIILAFSIISCVNQKGEIYVQDDISLNTRVKGDSFELYSDGEFRKKFLTGVNMGAGMPGAFPGELKITKEMYLEWFKLIHDMSADVVRIYTTMKPEFYEALYQFNQTVIRPLYIMQGVWVNEEDIKNISDAYGENEKIKNNFIADALDLVDIIHGNKTLEPKPGFASGEYTYDVSRYVIGWIMGIEWEVDFVNNTNTNNLNISGYFGEYLETTKKASAFESFLAEVGDKVISYEVDNYKYMRPLSFVNWPTTDHLTHPNEPDEREDLVSVNMNNIRKTNKYTSGFFASFHIYPYYPEFLNYSQEYRDYIDHRGEINAYQAYLKDLKKHLDMPVIVAEFGVPASRGKTHQDMNHGFNQGYLSETRQGEIVTHLLEDIYESDYAGGLVFTWQDEWFKRTWNTMDLDLAHRRPFWSNIQTNEQYFGILSFEPGDNGRIRYVDGDLTDWNGSEPFFTNDNLEIHSAFDERYIYLRIDSKTLDIEKNRILLAISTNPNQGNNFIKDTQIDFTKTADFIIDIRGKEYAEVKVDAYYDPFYFMYHEKLGMLDKIPEYRNKNTGKFNSIYQALSSQLYLPEDDEYVSFMKHKTGLLTYGIGNPESPYYNSLADYFIKKNTIELQIPWLLLNISDPSTKMRLGDFYENDWFQSEEVESFYIGGDFISVTDDILIEMTETTWSSWQNPSFHTRLKKSYYIIKAAFNEYS